MILVPRIARYVERYCNLGFSLTWSPPGEKGPRHPGWNDPAKAITDPKAALEFWSAHPDYGTGALLGPSRKVTLDVDHVAHTRISLSELGVDLDAIEAPRIIGNPEKFRLMFEAPPGIELRHRTAALPQQDDLRKSFAVFELRAGLVSDALPPTIHTTGRPYRWAVPPRNGFPPLPARLLELWIDWPETARKILARCPWAPPPAPPARASKSGSSHRWDDAQGKRESVIDAFNQAHDAAVILESHGYVRRDKRFTSPDSSHAAGIVFLDSGKVFCHHQGDVLASEHALDAFDVYRILDHGGDYRAAVKAAAQALGLDRNAA